MHIPIPKTTTFYIEGNYSATLAALPITHWHHWCSIVLKRISEHFQRTLLVCFLMLFSCSACASSSSSSSLSDSTLVPRYRPEWGTKQCPNDMANNGGRHRAARSSTSVWKDICFTIQSTIFNQAERRRKRWERGVARGCVERRLKSVRAGAAGEIGSWVDKWRLQGDSSW